MLAAWFVIAGCALMVAIAALVYGAPASERPAVAIATVDDAPATTGSIGRPPAAVGGDGLPGEGGRSDIIGAFGPASAPPPSALASEVARMRIENMALRQSVEQLRGEIDGLSERLQHLEGRLAGVTGSLAPAEKPRAPLFIDTPDVAPEPGGQAGAAALRFGVELGAFSDLAAVKTSWRQLSKTYANLFASLQGLVSVRDRDGGTELRLIAGPFRSAADANEHCGKLEAAGIGCQPAFFIGQPLSSR